MNELDQREGVLSINTPVGNVGEFGDNNSTVVLNIPPS